MATTYSLARRLAHMARQVKSSPLISPQTDEDRNIRLLYLNTAMVGVPSGGIVAFLPVFLARLGVSSTVMSWLTSAPALLSILVLIPAALITERNTDQVRVRSLYMRMDRAGFLICALAPFVVPTHFLPAVLIFVWMFRTLPDAVAIPAWTSVMARAVSPRNRARMNSTRWALLALVSAGSSAFFGWMLDRIIFPYNYQIVFFISAAFGWLDTVFFARISVPPLPIPTFTAARSLKARLSEYFGPVLAHRPFWVFIATTILYRVALNLPAPLFSLYWVNQLHAPDTLIGLRGTVGNAALVIGYLFWGRAASRMGHRHVLWLAAVSFALYPIATALIPGPIWLLPVAAVWGLTVGGIDVGLFDMMLAFCPQHRQPLFAAVYQMIANVAVFIGPLLGAALSDATSMTTALIVAGILQMVVTIPFVVLPKDV